MNNEEKILEMLEKLNGTVEKQGKLLEKHGEMLEKIDQRMDRMDQRMDRMEERIDQIDERSQRTALLMETEVSKKLNLLYEGHGLIMESLDKLATQDRVGKLEDEIIVLKTAFKTLSQRLSELEKAQ